MLVKRRTRPVTASAAAVVVVSAASATVGFGHDESFIHASQDFKASLKTYLLRK